MYGGLRALGEKPDLALVTCDVDAISAGYLLPQVANLNLIGSFLFVYLYKVSFFVFHGTLSVKLS